MDRQALHAWVELYERAWRTPGTALLAELFAHDATYSTAPFEELHRGLEAIERLWEAERDGPDEPFTLETEIVAVEGDTGVVRVEVHYERPPQHYRDLWIVRVDGDGRCAAFEEWPFWPKPAK
jgi:ketosteroid isomerase-like protein